MKKPRFQRPTRQQSKDAVELFRPIKKEYDNVTTKKNDKPEMQSLSGDFVEFKDAGDIVEGYYSGYTYTTIIQRGEEVSVPKFMVDTEEGMKEFLGTTTITEILPRVPNGTYVMISYLGKEKTRSGFEVKKFDIQCQKGVQLLPNLKDPHQRQSLYAADGQYLGEDQPNYLPF